MRNQPIVFLVTQKIGPGFYRPGPSIPASAGKLYAYVPNKGYPQESGETFDLS